MTDMEKELSWIVETGLDTEAGIGYTGGPDKYLSAVRRFYRNYEKNRAKVEQYYSAGDNENYMITVHALKSNSKMIGATDLSLSFEALENAARNGDDEYIRQQTESVLASYGDLVEQLKPIEETGDVAPADEISGTEAREIADRLLAALDDFDDEKSKELAGTLSHYPFRITQKGRLREAVNLIEDFMYDDAADIIREISAEIE